MSLIYDMHYEYYSIVLYLISYYISCCMSNVLLYFLFQGFGSKVEGLPPPGLAVSLIQLRLLVERPVPELDFLSGTAYPGEKRVGKQLAWTVLPAAVIV